MKEIVPNEKLGEQTEAAEPSRETVHQPETQLLETEVAGAERESVEVRAGLEVIKNGGIGAGDAEIRAAAETAAFVVQQSLDALRATAHEADQLLRPDTLGARVAAPRDSEHSEQTGDSIWSQEVRREKIDSIEIAAPEHFSALITEHLSSLQLPRRLYAGDKIAPIRPIDVFAAAAERAGAKSKRIHFTIADVPSMDVSDDGEALVISLSKFELTNPRLGLLGALSLHTRTLLLNRGEIVMDRTARESIATQTTDYVFDRARHGEALGYQIPPEHQRAYYRGIDYDALKPIAEAGSFVGRNADALLAALEPTVWAYTDPGMAESFGGRGKGVVFKMKKSVVDERFKTEPGWQRWTVNEVMIQAKEDGADSVAVPLGDTVEEILVFDDVGEQAAAELFPDIPRTRLGTKEDGEQYLADHGEMTNGDLEQHYDDPKKMAGYVGQADENPIFALCQIEPGATYEDCRRKMEAKRDEFGERIFGLLGLGDPKKRRYMGEDLELRDTVQAVWRKDFFRLPKEVQLIVNENPGVVDEVKTSFRLLNDVDEVLANFDAYDDVRQVAERFKQQR